MRSNTLASLCAESLYIHSVRLPLENGLEYETSTPYFILIEYLYLSCQNHLSAQGRPAGETGADKISYR